MESALKEGPSTVYLFKTKALVEGPSVVYVIKTPPMLYEGPAQTIIVQVE